MTVRSLFLTSFVGLFLISAAVGPPSLVFGEDPKDTSKTNAPHVLRQADSALAGYTVTSRPLPQERDPLSVRVYGSVKLLRTWTGVYQMTDSNFPIRTLSSAGQQKARRNLEGHLRRTLKERGFAPTFESTEWQLVVVCDPGGDEFKSMQVLIDWQNNTPQIFLNVAPGAHVFVLNTRHKEIVANKEIRPSTRAVKDATTILDLSLRKLAELSVQMLVETDSDKE